MLIDAVGAVSAADAIDAVGAVDAAGAVDAVGAVSAVDAVGAEEARPGIRSSVARSAVAARTSQSSYQYVDPLESPAGRHRTTMTGDTRINQGVELETLAAFAEHAAENPDDVQLGLGASATYEGTAAHSLAKIDSYQLGGETISRETREYTLPYGGWKEVLDAGGWVGATDRLEPVEAALSALAACINVGITINAVANGVEIDHLRTDVRADFDPAVLFSLADLSEADSVFENVTAEIQIEGDDLDDELVDEWARRAPVYTLVSLGQDVQLTVDTPAQVAGDD